MSPKQPQVSPNFPDAFYRVSVKGLCMRDGKVLLVSDTTGRSDTDPRAEWELPGGGMDFGEYPVDALKREIKEEMGLTVKWIEDKPKYIIPIKREKSRGMDWYYVLAVMFRFEVENLDFTPTDECREIRFFSKEELKANYDDLSAAAKPFADIFDPKDFE